MLIFANNKIEYDMDNRMKDYLPPMDTEKLNALFEIENAFKAGKLSSAEAQQQI